MGNCTTFQMDYYDDVWSKGVAAVTDDRLFPQCSNFLQIVLQKIREITFHIRKININTFEIFSNVAE